MDIIIGSWFELHLSLVAVVSICCTVVLVKLIY